MLKLGIMGTVELIVYRWVYTTEKRPDGSLHSGKEVGFGSCFPAAPSLRGFRLVYTHLQT